MKLDKVCVNEAEYVCERLLGRGKGGYTYLARAADGAQVALKQIHHEPCDYYEFGDKLGAEVGDYSRLRELGIRMPALLDVDRKRERLVKEYISGPTVFELVERDDLDPECLEQIGEMCRRLYPVGLNIDYFPTNFVWHQGRLYYVDYECNPYSEKWNFENWGRTYWSRTPEFLEQAARLHAEAALRSDSRNTTEELDGRKCRSQRV